MANGQQDIRIAPILMGSKNQGVFNIILGAVLIVAGTLLAPYTGGASTFLVKLGWGLVIGGVMQLLAPAPKGRSPRDRPDNQPSHTFDGPINTQAQGHPVPVLYGELIVGSAVISAGINAVDQAYIPRTTPGAGSGGGGGGAAPPWHEEHDIIVV